jgi:hypothetical protein
LKLEVVIAVSRGPSFGTEILSIAWDLFFKIVLNEKGTSVFGL